MEVRWVGLRSRGFSIAIGARTSCLRVEPTSQTVSFRFPDAGAFDQTLMHMHQSLVMPCGAPPIVATVEVAQTWTFALLHAR